jgi:CRISPR-associated endonuclease/helicase Cas3
MPIPINTFRKWFAGDREGEDQESDLPIGIEGSEPEQRRSIRAVVWRGDESVVIRRASEVRPGQTLILAASVGGWNELGHVQDGTPIDMGDRAAFETRRSVSLRLHPALMKEWPEPEGATVKAVAEYAGDDDAEADQMKQRLMAYFAKLDTDAAKGWPHAFLDSVQRGELRLKLNLYPGRRIAHVLEGRKISLSSRQRTERVILEDHLRNVEAEIEKLRTGLPQSLEQPLRAAAIYHDYGKVDVRYQAWLFGGDLMAAQYCPKPIAKSGLDSIRRQEAVGLPRGFRHELLSLMFAERSPDIHDETRDLILHLVASHHGRCRPFAPVIPDGDADCVSYGGISICRAERVRNAPHRIDSEVADRFWKLTRQYGWWGLAYLEALLRLADWRASEGENSEVSE